MRKKDNWKETQDLDLYTSGYWLDAVTTELRAFGLGRDLCAPMYILHNYLFSN